MTRTKTDILVLGSGIAGLTFAIKASRLFPDRKILVLTKTTEGESNTRYAEVRNAQENVRLSNAQQSKAFQELTEYKKRIEQNDAENDGIKRKIQNLVQENQHLNE